jgi:hypothetical protein
VNVWRDPLDECMDISHSLYGSVWILDDGRVVPAGGVEIKNLCS